MDYFISDTHFGHSNILKFERTSFKDIQEHDNYIWDLIFSTVKKNDRLFHLGDFGLTTEENLEKWKSIPAYTILIRGNHDNSINKLKEVFNEVHNEPIFYKKRILLSHEPLPVTKGTLNIHGHLHGSKLSLENYLNISLHESKYKLLNEKQIEKMLHTLEKDNYKFMFEWYAKYYDFTIPNKDVYFKDDGSIDLEKTQLHLKEKKKDSRNKS